jgi:hypothetical protein
MALLGAECAVREPEDEVTDAHRGFSLHEDRWAALGEGMRAHVEARGPMVRRLIKRLGLSEASYWLVQLCVAVEVYPDAAAAVSLISEDERLHLVTPSCFARLSRAALSIPFTHALSEALAFGAATRLGLIERVDFTAWRPLAQQPLRITALELRIALEESTPEVEPTTLVLSRESPGAGTAMDARRVAGSAALLEERGVLCIRSASARAGRQLALDVASIRQEGALIVTAGEEVPDAAEVLRLRGGLPVLDLFGPCSARGFPEGYVRSLARHLRALVVVAPWSAATSDLAAVEADSLDREVARRVFALGLGDDPAAASLSARFRVNLEEVRAAVRAARDAARVTSGGGAEPDTDAIAAEILSQGARRMGRLVTRLQSSASLDHLIVPPRLRQDLQDVVGWYRARARVFDEWRVAERTPLGRGLTCLFSGPTGTGKTFAAQCLSNALGLNLYRIDLSQVVSKYIGETEKALSKIFDEAEAGHGVLLFDEADALFGKRSEVKDAHDRYANVEVGYLLQRFESFDGVSILTTNLRNNLDAAFLRRLRFVLEFPMPDGHARRRLWEQSLPPRQLWDRSVNIDLFIERFALSGGNIQNIGVAAAHLAAASPDGALSIEHLVRATYRELEKTGLPRSRDDFGPLAAYLPGRS